ncbi:MAG: D-alanine--poly(phosphoribitol) ligase subunit DltC [Eggerthellales bacterium]|nr:D-alanine--poly(phosphoribitol) ligase subunit DltC [Eggerthellales bacterium]
MSKEATSQEILDLVCEICGDDCVYDELDLDLFEEGLFDSLAAIEFLVEVEERFGVSIAPTELERQEMNTPQKIVDRIMERL